MASKQIFNWSETKMGLMTLLSRNAILIIAINVLNQCVINFKNSWRSLAVMKDAGQSPVTLGLLISFLMIVAMFTRPVSGGMMDALSKNLKTLTVVVMAVKACVPLLFLISLSKTWLYVVFFIDSVTWAAAHVIVTAMMAVIINRKALGSGFAIMTALTVILAAYPRGWGVNVFNSMGLTQTAWITFAAGVVLVLLVLGINNEKLQEEYQASAMKKQEKAKLVGAAATEKKGILSKITWSAIPLALLMGWPYFYQSLITTYMPVYATDNGFNYASATAIGGTIAGIATIFIGVLCDFISPYFVVLAAYLINFISPLALMNGGSNQMFMLGIILFYSMSRSGTMPLQILNFRKHDVEQQGQVSATNFFCMDLCSIISSTLCGYLVQNSGYAGSFKAFAVLNGIMIIVLIIFMIHSFKKEKSAKAEAAAE